jgi:formylglycine-generating enzyme required for sulfatase activity
VHGNVWEWTEDCWNGSNEGNPGNGSARTTGDCTTRIVRGGSWLSIPQDLRAAVRNWYATGFRLDVLGFRLARTLNP